MSTIPTGRRAPRLVYTVQEGADALREPRKQIGTLCRTRAFPNSYKGGDGGKTSPWRIPVKDVEAFMRERARAVIR